MRLYDLKALGRQTLNRFQSARGQLWENLHRSEELPALGREHRLQAHIEQGPRNYDGYDSSRQGVALYAREGEPQQPYRVELEVAHLRPGAVQDALKSSFQLSWPGQTYRVEPGSQGPQSLPYNRLQLAVDKQDLRQLGWTDGQPLDIRVSTQPKDQLRGGSQVSGRSDVPEQEPIFRWEGKTIYYAVTDRFQQGRPERGPFDRNDPQRFHGGDWKGITSKLDYLKELNVDALWISCPYENQRDYLSEDGSPKDGFHAYWPKNFEEPEPSFGSKADLKELIEQAHQRDLKVILDVVLNHTSYDHPLIEQKPDWFHHNGPIRSSRQWDMENGSLCGLPDLDQDNPEVRDYLQQVHRDWLALGFDGFRLDAVRHVPEPFLRGFNDAMKESNPEFYSVGECFWQDANFVAGYQNRTLDSMFDFPLAYAIREVFAGDPSRTPADLKRLGKELEGFNDQEAERMRRSGNRSLPMTRLSEVFKQDALYDNPGKLATLVDNHDMVRFMSDTGGDLRKLEIAMAFLYAARGTPCIYYGTEVGMDGFGANNRDDMEWGKNPQFTQSIAKLVEVRNSSEALQFGSQVERLATQDSYALSRLRPDEEVICLFNNSEEAQMLRVPLGHLEEGSGLKDLLSQEPAVIQQGQLKVKLPPKGYAFYQHKSF